MGRVYLCVSWTCGVWVIDLILFARYSSLAVDNFNRKEAVRYECIYIYICFYCFLYLFSLWTWNLHGESFENLDIFFFWLPCFPVGNFCFFMSLRKLENYKYWKDVMNLSVRWNIKIGQVRTICEIIIRIAIKKYGRNEFYPFNLPWLNWDEFE